MPGSTYDPPDGLRRAVTCAMLERGILAGKKAERFEGETPQLALDMLDMLLGSREAQQDDAAPDARALR